MFNFLRGKKTYIIAAITAASAGAEILGYPSPSWLFPLLGAAGLGAVRSAIRR
jgi:MYXO-CTERM domain-containing protein